MPYVNSPWPILPPVRLRKKRNMRKKVSPIAHSSLLSHPTFGCSGSSTLSRGESGGPDHRYRWAHMPVSAHGVGGGHRPGLEASDR